MDDDDGDDDDDDDDNNKEIEESRTRWARKTVEQLVSTILQ